MAQPRNVFLDGETFNALVDLQTQPRVTPTTKPPTTTTPKGPTKTVTVPRPYPLPPITKTVPVDTKPPTKPTVQPKGGTTPAGHTGTNTPAAKTTPAATTKSAQNPTDSSGTVDPTLAAILGALGSDGTGGSAPVDPAYTTGATIPAVTPATATQSGGAPTALVLLLLVGLLVGGYFIYEKYRAKLKTDVAAEQQGVKPHA